MMGNSGLSEGEITSLIRHLLSQIKLEKRLTASAATGADLFVADNLLAVVPAVASAE